jgi:transcriptional regulator with XRE-family HTH domain
VTTFADRLRTLRRAAGLSQTELAGDGLSPSYISLLESGRRRPSPAVAAQLASKLGCSTTELLDGEPSEHERRLQLELAYAELALRHDGAEEAVGRLMALLAEPGLPAASSAEAGLLLARAQERTGDLAAAVATLTLLLERAMAGDPHLSVPRVAVHLCFCHSEAGNLTRAVTVGEQALEVCRQQDLERTDDYFMLASTVMLAYADLGDESHASAWARRLIEDAGAAGSTGGQAALYWNASLLAEREGRLTDALYLSRRALANLGELGDSRDLARLKLDVTRVLLASDEPDVGEAASLLEQVRSEVRRLGSEVDVVEHEELASRVALLALDPGDAEVLARAATQRMPIEANAKPLSLAYRALGDALAAQGRRGEAMEQWTTAADLQAMSNPGRATALSWRDLAERFRAAGDTEAAVSAYRASLDAAGVRDRTKAVLGVIAELEARAGVPSTDAANP